MLRVEDKRLWFTPESDIRRGVPPFSLPILYGFADFDESNKYWSGREPVPYGRAICLLCKIPDDPREAFGESKSAEKNIEFDGEELRVSYNFETNEFGLDRGQKTVPVYSWQEITGKPELLIRMQQTSTDSVGDGRPIFTRIGPYLLVQDERYFIKSGADQRGAMAHHAGQVTFGLRNVLVLMREALIEREKSAAEILGVVELATSFSTKMNAWSPRSHTIYIEHRPVSEQATLDKLRFHIAGIVFGGNQSAEQAAKVTPRHLGIIRHPEISGSGAALYQFSGSQLVRTIDADIPRWDPKNIEWFKNNAIHIRNQDQKLKRAGEAVKLSIVYDTTSRNVAVSSRPLIEEIAFAGEVPQHILETLSAPDTPGDATQAIMVNSLTNRLWRVVEWYWDHLDINDAESLHAVARGVAGASRRLGLFALERGDEAAIAEAVTQNLLTRIGQQEG